MSRYRHPGMKPKPRTKIDTQCQAACDQQATTLKVYRGRLSWVCDRHANECPNCHETHEETR